MAYRKEGSDNPIIRSSKLTAQFIISRNIKDALHCVAKHHATVTPRHTLLNSKCTACPVCLETAPRNDVLLGADDHVPDSLEPSNASEQENRKSTITRIAHIAYLVSPAEKPALPLRDLFKRVVRG